MGAFQEITIPKIKILDLSGNAFINFNDQSFTDLSWLDISSNRFLSTFKNCTLPNIKVLLLDHNLLT
jgi:hypothetical protein